MRLHDLSGRVEALDREAERSARARQDRLTKPPGSLGFLEDLGVQMAGIFGTERPALRGRSLIVAAADHGVAAREVSAYPQEVTSQMVRNFLAGGAAVNVMARRAGVELVVVDAGIAVPLPRDPRLRVVDAGRMTQDITLGPAMTMEQAEKCVLVGVELAQGAVRDGADVLGVGEMGIGNTTAASAIAAVVTGRSPMETTGRGTGIGERQLAHKVAIVDRAIEINDPRGGDALEVLSKVGGLEIGVLAGVMLGAAIERRVVVLDGFITGAAALIACSLNPRVKGYLVASHQSSEKGHQVVLSHLGLRPVLDLGMRLGEGTGAVLAMGIVDAAAACLSEMATFEEAQVSGGGRCERGPDT